MNVDFNTPLFDLDEPIVDYKKRAADGKPDVTTEFHVCLGNAAITALAAPVPDEQLSEEAKLHRFELRRSIFKAMRKDGLLDITSDDAALIKRCIGKVYAGPVMFGVCGLLLDQRN